MKEFNFLNEANKNLRLEKWQILFDATACMCIHSCSHKVEGAAHDFILSAPYSEQKFLNIPTLLVDMSTLHAHRRKEGILGEGKCNQTR